MRVKLSEPTSLVDWSADGRPRPQIQCRKGTQVNLRITKLGYGTVYTVWVRRKGRVWSMTRCRTPKGRTIRCFYCEHYHAEVSQ